MGEFTDVSIDSNIATILLNRQESFNAVDLPTAQELSDFQYLFQNLSSKIVAVVKFGDVVCNIVP